VDIDKIKSGRPKPVFVIALEWVTLTTLAILLLALIASQFAKETQQAVTVLLFILLIEFGLLSILYGIEGVRYKMIWLTYPALSGPRRIGFSRTGSFLVSAAYVLMGLALILLAIMFVYYNSRPA
jgi:hypothetical protein